MKKLERYTYIDLPHRRTFIGTIGTIPKSTFLADLVDISSNISGMESLSSESLRTAITSSWNSLSKLVNKGGIIRKNGNVDFKSDKSSAAQGDAIIPSGFIEKVNFTMERNKNGHLRPHFYETSRGRKKPITAEFESMCTHVNNLFIKNNVLEAQISVASVVEQFLTNQIKKPHHSTH